MKAAATPPTPGLGYRLMQAIMCPLLRLFGMSCRTAATLSASRLDRPLTSGETLRLQIHCLLCHLCRPLPRQFENLRHLARCCGHDHPDGTSAPATLPPEARERIHRALSEEARRS